MDVNANEVSKVPLLRGNWGTLKGFYFYLEDNSETMEGKIKSVGNLVAQDIYITQYNAMQKELEKKEVVTNRKMETIICACVI